MSSDLNRFMKTFGDRAPEDLPLYGVEHAAALLHLPPSTLRAWACGWRSGGPLFDVASRNPAALSFTNMIEAYVLAAMRKVHKISMQRVRMSLEFVAREMGVDRPLCSASFKTDGIDLFIENAGLLMAVSSGRGQLILREIVEASLERIEWHDGVAAALYLPVRVGEDLRQQPRSIVIDPRRGFGKPVITGTGIEASVVAGRYRAGESVQDLAVDYGLDASRIEDAIRCEMREAA